MMCLSLQQSACSNSILPKCYLILSVLNFDILGLKSHKMALVITSRQNQRIYKIYEMDHDFIWALFLDHDLYVVQFAPFLVFVTYPCNSLRLKWLDMSRSSIWKDKVEKVLAIAI